MFKIKINYINAEQNNHPFKWFQMITLDDSHSFPLQSTLNNHYPPKLSIYELYKVLSKSKKINPRIMDNIENHIKDYIKNHSKDYIKNHIKGRIKPSISKLNTLYLSLVFNFYEGPIQSL